MTEVDEDARRAGLAALERVMAVRAADELPDALLAAAAEAVAADGVALTAVGPTGAPTHWSRPDRLTAAPLIDGFERHAADFVLARHTRRGSGAALRRSDLLGDLAFRAAPVYADYFRPAGVEHVLAVSHRLPDDRVACLALARAGRDFTDRDVAVLTAVGRQLGAAARFARLRWPRPHPTVRVPTMLTPTEVRVLEQVTLGLTDRAIARRLGVAESTVRKHLEHAYRKIGVTNRVAATVACLSAAPPGSR